MNITIIGGSGGTGAALADQAFLAGHEVTVVSRSGRGAGYARKVAVPDVSTASGAEQLADAIHGADAVVVTVGGSRGTERNRARTTQAVIAAMKSTGVRRLIVQSSLGAGDSAQQMRPPLRQLAMMALAKPLADHNEQEQAVRASSLDWTIVRPSGLSNAPATGNYSVLTVDEKGFLGKSISRSDVAAFILDLVTEKYPPGASTAKGSVGKSYGIAAA